MKAWLNTPYPLIVKTHQKLLLAFGFGVFVYGFLLVYQPFGASDIKAHKALFLLGFAICVVLGLLCTYIMLPALFPSVFHPDKWIIRKEILYVLLSFLIIATFNYFYNTIVGKDIARPQSFLNFIGITISIGFFPVLGLIFFTEKYLKEKNEVTAKAMASQLEQTATNDIEQKRITLQSDTIKSDAITLSINDFIFAKAEDNYAVVHYLQGQNPQKIILRLSLKTIEQQLKDSNTIIRCHKSFIVNKTHIKTIKGNARSLYLEMYANHIVVPVSRSFPREKLS